MSTPHENLRRNYVVAPPDDYLVETLEISHSKFTKTHYITNYPEPISAALETGVTVSFVPIPFSVTLPRLDGQGKQDLSFGISNVGQEMVLELEAASTAPQERIALIHRVYTTNDLTGPGSTPIHLSVDAIGMSDEAITATANRADILNRRFPSDLYDTAQFPGLDRG